jgi:hypothetical protein
MRTILFAATLAAALAAPAAADRAEHDLQVVKKAVGSTAVAQARPPAEEPPAEARPAKSKGGPRWLRIRVSEKAGKHGRVSINLPIGIARALGDDWPISHRGGCREHCPTLGEVLRALDSGQSLVEIDDDDATVRVWVD